MSSANLFLSFIRKEQADLFLLFISKEHTGICACICCVNIDKTIIGNTQLNIFAHFKYFQVSFCLCLGSPLIMLAEFLLNLSSFF